MSVNKENLSILGMSCTSCSNSLQRSINNLEGVMNAIVSFETKKLSFEYDGDLISLENIEKAVEECGYKAEKKAVIKNLFPTVASKCSCR